MYPGHHFLLFPPFPRNNRVFVAMSFDDAFQERWMTILKPAIEEVGLEPYRVNAARVSNSIMHQILEGIGEAKLFLGDISSVAHVRNGNVMYEVGIAHATRLPEEVILFRNDRDPLPFDVQGINVNSYDPYGDSAGAKELVKQALQEAMVEVNLGKHIAVEKAIQSLDAATFHMLFYLLNTKNMREELKGKELNKETFLPEGVPFYSTITRLLELGLISTDFLPIEEWNKYVVEPTSVFPQVAQYSFTYFGKVVFINMLKKQGEFKWVHCDDPPAEKQELLDIMARGFDWSVEEIIRHF